MPESFGDRPLDPN